MSSLDGWEIPKWALSAKPSMVKIYRIASNDFIIFKNINAEIDWILSDDYDNSCTDEIRSYIDSVHSRIIFILSYLPKDIDESVKEDIHIMCSEALASIFNKDNTLSTEILASTEERISLYKYEKYLRVVYKTVGNNFAIMCFIILIAYLFKLNIITDYQVIVFTILAFCVGAIGSIASILFKKKEVDFKENIKNESIVDDTNYKILLGGIFASVAYAMVSSGILEPFKSFSFRQSIVIFFLCGFSERFAPSIFEKFNKD